MTFECRDEAGILGSNGQKAKGAYWPIGVLAAPPVGGSTKTAAAPASDRSTITAALVTDNDRINVPIAADTTDGLLATGTLLLNLDNVDPKTRLFTIEFSSRTRFPRPPRLLRLEPNVIPIKQGQTIIRESQAGTGQPDFSFKLEVSGLRFAAREDPLTLEVAESKGVETWKLRERLSECGPADNVYELDAAKGQITFGNGVNGRVPPANSEILITYSVSDGTGGSVARNRKWKVAGFGNTFGVNPDPINGGGAPSALLDDRREARRRVREEHALINSTDIEAAAKALPLLEVARTWVPAAPNQAPRTGVVPLVALRSRAGGEEPEQAPETAEWLNELRRQLSPDMPLGSRLMVTAPRYVEFYITAVIEANAGLKPETVKEAVEDKLKQRLALVDTASDVTPRQPGVPVTFRDVGAWLRATEGVKRVIEWELHGAAGQKIDDEVVVPRDGLPRCLFSRNSIEVKRPEPGRSR
jgi:predicted phage baseplate assembly protein